MTTIQNEIGRIEKRIDIAYKVLFIALAVSAAFVYALFIN